MTPSALRAIQCPVADARRSRHLFALAGELWPAGQEVAQQVAGPLQLALVRWSLASLALLRVESSPRFLSRWQEVSLLSLKLLE